LYPGETPVATETKPKARRTIAKAAPPVNTPYSVEMIRGSKREENKF
jgi:hypothetical protein